MAASILKSIKNEIKQPGIKLNKDELTVIEQAAQGNEVELGDHARIRGKVIRALLLNLYRTPYANSKGLVLRWKNDSNPNKNDLQESQDNDAMPVIEGPVELPDGCCPEGHALPQLNINDFAFDGIINLRGAAIANIDLTRCRNVKLDAGNARVRRDIWLSETRITGNADFSGATIGGDFYARGASFNYEITEICKSKEDNAREHSVNDAQQKLERDHKKMLALQLDDAEVSGSINLTEARVLGRASLARIKVAGRLNASDVHFRDPEIKKIINYKKQLKSAKSAEKAEKTKKDIHKLNKKLMLGLQSAHIVGDLLMHRAKCYGQVICTSIEVGGIFGAEKAIFFYPLGTALKMDGVTIRDDIRIAHTWFIGQVDAAASYAKGQLNANSAHFIHYGSLTKWRYGLNTIASSIFAQTSSPEDIALRMDRAHINGGAFFKRSKIIGRFHGNGSRFAFIRFCGAKCNSLINDTAISLSSAIIDIRMEFMPIGDGEQDDEEYQTVIIGAVNLDHTEIGSLLDISGAHIYAALKPEIRKRENQNQPPGDISYKNRPICLSLRWAKIPGVLRTENIKGRNGDFDLRGAQIDTIDDDVDTGWPTAEDIGQLRLDGLVYRDINMPSETEAKSSGSDEPKRTSMQTGGVFFWRRWLAREEKNDNIANKRIEWLKRAYPNGEPSHDHPFRPQPFQQMIMTMRIRGHDTAARKVEIAKRKLQLDHVDQGVEKFVNRLLRLTSSFGYSPQRALFVYIGWVAFGAVLSRLALINKWIEVANTDIPVNKIMHMEPITYAFDLTTPIFNFGQATAYRLTPYCITALPGFCNELEFFEFIYSIIGMTLFSILVLTLTGVLRRDYRQ